MDLSRRAAASITIGALVFCLVSLAALAAGATLSGRLLGPDGRPAAGFLVIAQDVFSGREVGSARTAEDGRYRMHLAAGSRYRLLAAVDPGGKRLALDPRPEIDVPVAGDFEAPDVSWSRQAPPRPAAAVSPPWYRSRAALSAFAAGGAAALYFALEDGGDERPASPFAP